MTWRIALLVVLGTGTSDWIEAGGDEPARAQLVWADFDGDGLEDVYLVRPDGADSLFKKQRGRLVRGRDRSRAALVVRRLSSSMLLNELKELRDSHSSEMEELFGRLDSQAARLAALESRSIGSPSALAAASNP